MAENKEKQQTTTNPNGGRPAETDGTTDRPDGYPANGCTMRHLRGGHPTHPSSWS